MRCCCYTNYVHDPVETVDATGIPGGCSCEGWEVDNCKARIRWKTHQVTPEVSEDWRNYKENGVWVGVEVCSKSGKWRCYCYNEETHAFADCDIATALEFEWEYAKIYDCEEC